MNDNNYGNSKNNDDIMQSFYEPPTSTTTTTRSTTLDAAAEFSLAAFHMNTSTFHRSTSTLQMTTSTQSTVSSDEHSSPPTRLTTGQSWKSHSYPPEVIKYLKVICKPHEFNLIINWKESLSLRALLVFVYFMFAKFGFSSKF